MFIGCQEQKGKEPGRYSQQRSYSVRYFLMVGKCHYVFDKTLRTQGMNRSVNSGAWKITCQCRFVACHKGIMFQWLMLAVKEAMLMSMEAGYTTELSLLPPQFSWGSTTTLTIKVIYKVK